MKEVFPYFTQLCNEMIGKSVHFTRLAGNSLLIYVDCQPRDPQGFVIWLEPTWHYCGQQGVIAGSRQAQYDGEHEEYEVYEKHFRQVAESLNPINNTKIIAIALDPLTFDLKVDLSNQTMLKTFVADPNDDETWHISDHSQGITLYGVPHGLTLSQKSSK